MKIEIKECDALVIPGIGHVVGVVDVDPGHGGSRDEPPEEPSLESVDLMLADGGEIPEDKLDFLFDNAAAFYEIECVATKVWSGMSLEEAEAESIRLGCRDDLDDILMSFG